MAQVTGMLLLGGSAVINALTGMNIYAAAFLIPIGVILYTAIGGLKATFMSSYIHTVRSSFPTTYPSFMKQTSCLHITLHVCIAQISVQRACSASNHICPSGPVSLAIY